MPVSGKHVIAVAIAHRLSTVRAFDRIVCIPRWFSPAPRNAAHH
jgi:ABC-type transport system involved in Fe-S cluster assembly fused permease/ATPase subunit